MVVVVGWVEHNASQTKAAPQSSLRTRVAISRVSGGKGDPTFDTAQAIAVMLEKHGTENPLEEKPGA